MAKRLSTGFTNEIGDVYVIDIYDDDFGGSSTDVQVDGAGFTQQFTGEYTNYTGGGIMATTTTVNLIADNTAVTDFVAVLTSRTEADLRMSISRNGSFWWAGLILPDVVQLDDIVKEARPIFQIQAVDGLARLKTIDYNDAGTAYTGKETVIEHILNCLNKIGTESLWTTNTFVTAYSKWLADGHAAGDNPSVLTRTRVRHLNFLRVDQTGKVTFRNCYDVLKEFCKTFNCNLFLSDGRFWFISPSEYANTLFAFAARHNFQKDGTASYVVGGANYALLGRKAQTGSTFSTYNLFRFGRGKYSYYPALKETLVRYKHFSTRNLTPGLQGTGGSFVATTIDDIDSVGGTAKLFFRGNLNYRVDFVDPADAQVTHGKFRIQIKIGTYYLSRPVTFVNTLYIIEEAAFWTTDVKYFEIIVPIFEDATDYTKVIEFITPPIVEDGDMEIYFVLLEITDNAGNSFTTLVTVPTTSLTNIYSEILLDGTIEGQYNISDFLAVNATTGNSDDAVIETLIGEGPTGSTFGAVDIYDGAAWLPSLLGWRYGGSGTYLPISQLLATEIMYRHKNPAERLDGDFQGKYDLWKCITYTVDAVTKNYGLIGGSFTAGSAIWSLDMVVLFRSASAVDTPTQENQTAIDDVTDAPPEIQPGGGIIPSNNGLTQTSYDDANEAAEPGLSTAITQGLVPMQTNLLIQDGDTVTGVEVVGAPGDSSFSAGDLITVIDPVTGLSQEFTVDDLAYEGDTTISVTSDTADQRLNINSYILHSPYWLLGHFGWMRRHFQKFQLFDYNTSIVTTDPLGEFWRIELISGFVGRYIQGWVLEVGQVGTATALYTLEVKKNGVAHISINFTSLTTTSNLWEDIDGSAPLANADVFTFKVTRTDATGATNAKGLNFTFIMI